MTTVEIFCDGACSGNPGPGGWGAILRSGKTVKELSGGDPATTNNRMELIGAISALESLVRPCRVVLTSDSQYLVKGMNEWLAGWVKKGWRTANGPVLNQDLWERLLTLSQKHQIEWKWVRGHNGHPENERCDQLAREAIGKLKGEPGAEKGPCEPAREPTSPAVADSAQEKVRGMVGAISFLPPIEQIRSLLETLGDGGEQDYHVIRTINEILGTLEGKTPSPPLSQGNIETPGFADTERIMAWLEDDPRDAVEAFPDPDSPERRIAYRVEWLLRETK